METRVTYFQMYVKSDGCVQPKDNNHRKITPITASLNHKIKPKRPRVDTPRHPVQSLFPSARYTASYCAHVFWMSKWFFDAVQRVFDQSASRFRLLRQRYKSFILLHRIPSSLLRGGSFLIQIVERPSIETFGLF